MIDDINYNWKDGFQKNKKIDRIINKLLHHVSALDQSRSQPGRIDYLN
jgi:hypothetical protein